MGFWIIAARLPDDVRQLPFRRSALRKTCWREIVYTLYAVSSETYLGSENKANVAEQAMGEDGRPSEEEVGKGSV